MEATEDTEALLQTLDLQRCMMIPLASGTVALKLQEWFAEANKTRYDHIASQIDSTLGDNEVGLLLISERHQVQFPEDIEVFYVSPPALDEFRRWLQNWAAQQQTQRAAAAAEEQAGKEESVSEATAGEESAGEVPSATEDPVEEQLSEETTVEDGAEESQRS